MPGRPNFLIEIWAVQDVVVVPYQTTWQLAMLFKARAAFRHRHGRCAAHMQPGFCPEPLAHTEAWDPSPLLHRSSLAFAWVRACLPASFHGWKRQRFQTTLIDLTTTIRW